MGKVTFTLEQVEPVLEKHWNLKLDEITEFSSYHDRVFQVTTTDGQKYILKVTSVYEEEMLQSQFSAMSRLKDHGFSVPAVILNTSSANYTECRSTKGENCVAYLLTYIPGEILRRYGPLSEQHLYDTGQLAGEIRKALKGLTIPGMDKMDGDSLWMIHNVDKLRHHIDIMSEDRQKLVKSVIHMFESDVQPVIPELEKGIIHSDIHDENVILIDTNDSAHTCETNGSAKSKYGLIDFGDIAYSCSIFDLATAVAYAMMQESTNGDAFLKRGKYVIQGYESKMDIDSVEKNILFASVCGRYCIELVNSELEILDQGEEANCELNQCERDGWEQLEKLLKLGIAKVYELWFG